MILLYHKVFSENLTHWWVDADAFHQQMIELKSKKVVYLDDYDPYNPDHVAITFDGVYENVLTFAAPILKKFNYPFELFVCGDHLGLSNEFDEVEPPARFANEAELCRLINMGARIQWHSNTHRNFKNLTSAEIERECIIPAKLLAIDPSGFKWLAYPYGEFSKEAKDVVSKFYKGAISCNQGDDKDIYALNRVIVTNQTKLTNATVTVVIASYNYGRFLVESVESVLRQTYKPSKIIISDDCSTDNTEEIGRIFELKYPGLVTFRKNQSNLGVVSHFNALLDVIDTEFYFILGADNRISSNYLEGMIACALADSKIGIVYTDYWLFGSRAEDVYNKVNAEFKGEIKEGFFQVKFPSFDEVSRKNLLDMKYNFIHGSSLFRTKIVKELGGYIDSQDSPEDFNLAVRIVRSGVDAVKTDISFLEYRQHSNLQTNQKFVSYAELSFYKQNYKQTLMEKAELKRKVQSMRNSFSWKAMGPYRRISRLTKRIYRKLIKR